jgi:ubiquitin-like protein Nedd8
MLIKVKTVSNRDLDITTIEPTNTVRQLKAAIEVIEGLPVDSIRLIFTGRPLVDEMTIEACGVTPGSTVHMILTLRGGAGL